LISLGICTVVCGAIGLDRLLTKAGDCRRDRS
jgi:hypothetical protein